MGTPFRFIHCGDLHLGAPFKYLPMLGKQVAAQVAEATYKAFSNVVSLALEERVDALLIAGDIYNSEDHNLAAQVRFVRELERLADKQIPVFIVQGNHDPADSWAANLTMPDNVHIFSSAEVERVPLLVNKREVAGVYGVSCASSTVKDNQVPNYKRLSRDEYAIGLLHGTVGSQVEHDVTGPCSMDDLLGSHMDYWALGHIHKRAVLHEEPWVVYAGNTQGLHRKEIGPKGCMLVQVSANGHTQATFHETNALRFETARIDISKLKSASEIEEMLRHKGEMLRSKYKCPILWECVLTGSGELYKLCAQEEVRQLWLTEAQGEEKGKAVFSMPYRLLNETTPLVDLESRRQLSDMIGDYLGAYDSLEGDTEADTVKRIREYLAERAEMKRLGKYEAFLTDDMLAKAYKRAEIEGVMYLLGSDIEVEQD